MPENRRLLLAILAILVAIAAAMGLNVDEILAPYGDVLTPSAAGSLTPTTFDAAATLTADWHDISTLVATFTWTETPAPSATRSATPPRTNTPRPTLTAAPLVTATRPTPTPEEFATPTIEVGLPPMTYAQNVSGVWRRIRECAGLSCADTHVYVAPGEIITLDMTISEIRDGFKWYPLWNRSGWIAVMSTDVPPTIYLRIVE